MSVPAGWSVAPLQDLCEFHNGLWKGKKGPFVTARVIRNTNFTADGRIDLSDVAALDVEQRQLAKRELQKNDIIIEKSGGGPKQPVGRVVLFDLDDDGYSFSNFTSVIRVKQGDKVDPAYLHRVLYWWYVSGVTELLQKRSTGIRNLDFNTYKTLEVPFPPLAEQKRIVSILDQAFAALDRARAHAEVNLADAENLFLRVAAESLDQIVRDSGTAAVGKIADHCLGKMLDRKKNKGVMRPYLRNLNVRWFNVDTLDVLEMRIEDHEAERYEVRKGDLLICEGGYPGRAAIYDSDDTIYFQKALHRVRFKDPNLSKVLMYWLYVEDRLGRLKSHFSGTGISHFTGKALAAYQMPVAAEDVTSNVVSRIDSSWADTRKLVSAYEEKLADIAVLRQSLLQQAFSGQLT